MFKQKVIYRIIPFLFRTSYINAFSLILQPQYIYFKKRIYTVNIQKVDQLPRVSLLYIINIIYFVFK